MSNGSNRYHIGISSHGKRKKSREDSSSVLHREQGEFKKEDYPQMIRTTKFATRKVGQKTESCLRHENLGIAKKFFPEFFLQDMYRDKHINTSTMKAAQCIPVCESVEKKDAEDFDKSKETEDWIRREYGLN